MKPSPSRRAQCQIPPLAYGVLQHQYDKLGNCIATTLPDRRTINKLYFGSGYLHRETLRSQGRMHTSFQYDHTGCLTGKQTKRPGAGILPDIILDRGCSYDNLDRLAGKKHNRHGQSDYRYNEHGCTRSKQTTSGTQYYHYDAEHRLTEVRIEQLNHTERYVYDALGQRIEKHWLDWEGNTNRYRKRNILQYHKT